MPTSLHSYQDLIRPIMTKLELAFHLKNQIQPIMAGIGSADICLPVNKCTTRAFVISIGLQVNNRIGPIRTVTSALKITIFYKVPDWQTVISG